MADEDSRIGAAAASRLEARASSAYNRDMFSVMEWARDARGGAD